MKDAICLLGCGYAAGMRLRRWVLSGYAAGM
jgi:hypothetical protein